MENDENLRVKVNLIRKWCLKPFLILATGGVIFYSCQPTDKVESMGDTTTGVDHVVVNAADAPGSQNMGNGIQTAMFIESVALGNMMEVGLGKLAEEKAKGAGLKNLGRLMVRDYEMMNDKLKTLSSAKGLKLPASLRAKQLQQVREMREMEPAYFEKLYIKMMIEDHNKDIELFKGAVHSPDTAVSNFARMFLPVLENHRERALNVRERMKD